MKINDFLLSLTLIAALGLLLSGCGAAVITGSEQADQINIARIDQMPNLPQPYKMRNWKKVAEDFDALAFDFERKGEHLPMIQWGEGPGVKPGKVFMLDTFVGWNHEGYESVTSLGAVNGASVAGIDKSNQNGQDWVKLCANYFNDQPGLGIYLNSLNDVTGRTFWYELFPNILFYRVYSYYPETEKMSDQFVSVADGWYKACLGLGGKVDPWTVPDFDHVSYNFLTGETFDNGLWTEAGSSAAIAWIEYMAYVKTGDEKYLTAAKWGMDYLQNTTQNPYYEILLPHGVFAAARMNAELGMDYDVEKLLNWCFDGCNKRYWGESVGKWGDLDASGLTCGVYPGADGYAFAMNTFNKANSLVPLVRYDDRFARAIGKWMLNAANSMRLYYSNGLPEDHQTDAEWSRKNDPTSCLTYEGLKEVQAYVARLDADYSTAYGEMQSGTFKEATYTDSKRQVLQESVVDGTDRLEHIWKAALDDAEIHILNIYAHVSGDEAFTVSYSDKPEGPYTEAFVVDDKKPRPLTTNMTVKGNVAYLKVEDRERKPGSSELDRFYVDDVYIVSKSDKRPFATGDAKDGKWAKTNFGLYGSSFAGIFGGIIEATDVEGILKLDCLKTDYFHKSAYPTYLYYNPYNERKKVEVDVGPKKKDIYDAVTGSFLKKDVAGKVKFSIPGDSAVLIVVTPSGGKLTRSGSQTLIDGIVVDYTR